jgi:hypothetical protein
MAVAGYMVERPDPANPGQYLKDRNGQPRDWPWVLRQWDRIAAAGPAVRLVVAEQSYTDLTGQRLADMQTRLAACRASGQLVFGYVAGYGGAVPFGPANTWWKVPGRNSTTQALLGPVTQTSQGAANARRAVVDQIDAWHANYPAQLDGIYVDEGPSDCLAPNTLGGQANIPGNYAAYCAHIQSYGYKIFLLAPQYDDADPNQAGWFRALPWDFVGLWEEKAVQYDTAFNAWNPCANTYTPWPTPSATWWDPVRLGRPASERAKQVHIINNGVRVRGKPNRLFPLLTQAQLNKLATLANMYRLMRLAVTRGSTTVWLTESWLSPTLGSVYDELPSFWSDEVGLCR